MKKNKLAFILAMITGLICLSNFVYKLAKFHRTDYRILLAGIFIVALGVSSFVRKNE